MKISFDEYQKLSYLIVAVMREFEVEGRDNVQQSDIINRIVQKMLIDSSHEVASEEKTVESTNKIKHTL